MQTKIYIACLLMLAALCGCKDSEEIGSLDEAVNAELAFTVSTGTLKETRMDATVVQSNNTFRGLQTLRTFPFTIASGVNTVTINDMPKTFETSGYTTQYDNKTAGNGNTASFFYINKCSFIPGVNAFLAYANATASPTRSTNYSNNTTVDDDLFYGKLDATIPLRGYPNEINFKPTQIVTSTDAANSTGGQLASYLTSIATATGWSTTTNSTLKAYYLNFIGQGNDGNMLIASSSTNITKYVGKLRTQISALSGLNTDDAAIKDAIITAIDAGYDANNDILKSPNPVNYPASLGMPAGAAAVRWTGSAFVAQTVTTTLANLNTITRFAFPAELYYRTNSRIKTSTMGNRESYYANTDWSDVLNGYEYDNGTVSRNTTAVAIKDPLQYAVGRLDIKLNPCAAGTLKDANNTDIVLDTKFPLTGIIVGSQRPVDFEFIPKAETDGTYSDVNVRFSFDPFPTGSTNTLHLSGSSSSAVASTLVLQTPNGEEVTIILEFQNNSSAQFRGKDGVVYPGTKFYLIGKLTPNASATDDYKKRVFTQDYITTVNMTVNTLANAYNVMPDILSGRLEVGVEVVTDWIQATPTVVTMN